MDEKTFWANEAEPTALAKVRRDLPETLSRADEFLLKTADLKLQAEGDLTIAREFVVDSEAALQVADVKAAALKDGNKELHAERVNFTRPIDDFKQVFLDAEAGVTKPRADAVGVYESKMSAYRRQLREQAQAAQREAERQLAEQRRKEEEAARKLREKAARLKTEEAKQRALQEAETREQAAQMMPTSVALSSAQPQTVASNVSELWRAEIKDVPKFLEWLITRPEWLCVLDFKDKEMNRLAKQCQNVVKVPGVEFHTKDSFRTKSR